MEKNADLFKKWECNSHKLKICLVKGPERILVRKERERQVASYMWGLKYNFSKKSYFKDWLGIDEKILLIFSPVYVLKLTRSNGPGATQNSIYNIISLEK